MTQFRVHKVITNISIECVKVIIQKIENYED